MVQPFAQAYAQLQERPETYVVLNTDDGWYVQDLVRNEPPYRQTPLILNQQRLPSEVLEWLQAEPGRAYFVNAPEQLSLGLEIRGPTRTTAAPADPP